MSEKFTPPHDRETQATLRVPKKTSDDLENTNQIQSRENKAQKSDSKIPHHQKTTEEIRDFSKDNNIEQRAWNLVDTIKSEILRRNHNKGLSRYWWSEVKSVAEGWLSHAYMSNTQQDPETKEKIKVFKFVLEKILPQLQKEEDGVAVQRLEQTKDSEQKTSNNETQIKPAGITLRKPKSDNK